MSRLHRQKLRLRSQQRADGLIEPASDAIDRDAFQEVGTSHAGVAKALELVERHEVRDPMTLSDALEHQREFPEPLPVGAKPRGGLSTFLSSLSPAELAELREELARKQTDERSEEPPSAPLPAPPAQNPPL